LFFFLAAAVTIFPPAVFPACTAAAAGVAAVYLLIFDIVSLHSQCLFPFLIQTLFLTAASLTRRLPFSKLIKPEAVL